MILSYVVSNQVREQPLPEENEITDDIKFLSRFPNHVCRNFNGYIVNGFRFHTKTLEQRRRCQNSGVVVVANTQSYASAKERNPATGDVTCYGVLKEIIELDYWVDIKICLFKCDWVSNGRGVKVDEHGFTLVNFSTQMYENELFIMATQAEQVFYVQDPVDTGWHVVIKTSPRDFYNMEEEGTNDFFEDFVQEDLNARTFLVNSVTELDDNIGWVRNDIDGIIVHKGDESANNVQSNQDIVADDWINF